MWGNEDRLGFSGQTDRHTHTQTDTLPVVGIDDDDLLGGCSCVGNEDRLGFSGQTDRHTHTHRQTLYL